MIYGRHVGVVFLVLAIGLTSCGGETWPPDVSRIEPTSHVLTPEQALGSFYLPPGYRIELVANEPFIEDPVAIDFDQDGRMFVVEMRSYMPDLDAEGEKEPVGRISVLEDDDGDGRMDRRTVFLDSLILPRAVKVLSSGILIAAPPNLILARDLDGDLVADEQVIVSDSFGSLRSNPEYNPNGLVWGIDNCLHNAQHGFVYCADDGNMIRDGRIAAIPTLFRGQWGVSMDDLGRMYRNFNEDPLHVDLVPATYFARNPNLVRTRGAYEDLVADNTVWPIRPNYGVNRGYREAVLREDGTLASFTAAGSPVVYRGGGFPKKAGGSVFVTEPAGNLVRRFALNNSNGMLSARNAYDEAEFLTSSDERFRPVNLHSGPDGALYVVDMYRGVIQHTTYLTPYLETHVREDGLQQPIGLGRIYRVVHESMERADRPRLSQATTQALVGHLDHPNGWWRDTAQRLLVERRDTSEAAAIRYMARSGDAASTRMHALWTLHGLGILGAADLLKAMTDAAPEVRAAAVRLSEDYLTVSLVRATLASLEDDGSPVVRRQLAATYGELPWPERREALHRVLVAHPHDSVITDLTISGLHGREFAFLEDLVTSADSMLADAITMLAAAHTNAAARANAAAHTNAAAHANAAAHTNAAARANAADHADAATHANAAAHADAATHASSAAHAGGAAHATGVAHSNAAARANAAADDLIRLAESKAAGDWLLEAVREGIALAEPVSEIDETGVAGVDSARFAAGRALFEQLCSVCHGRDGRGMEGVAPSLSGSPWVSGPKGRLIRIVLDGKEGEQLMPPFQNLSDHEIADVLTFIRRSWGHAASPVTDDEVDMVRDITAERNAPWTDEELIDIK